MTDICTVCKWIWTIQHDTCDQAGIVTQQCENCDGKWFNYGKEVLITQLPEDTQIWEDDGDYFHQWDVGDLIAEYKDYGDGDKEHVRCADYYIADLEDMKQYDMTSVADNIFEHMGEECQDWEDKNEESFEPLKKLLQEAHDKRWKDVNHKIYARKTKVIFNIE